MKWFKSLSTIAKLGVLAGVILLLCMACFVFSALLPDSDPQEKLTQEQMVASVMAQVQQTQGGATEPSSTATDSPTDIPSETPQPTVTRNPNLLSAGTYVVGSDIQAGFYRGYAGFDLFESCYWSRLSDLSGEFEAILANDNANGQFYIEVRNTDVALEVDCNFEFLPNLPENSGSFPDAILPGTYLVNRDIRPGTYQGQAGSDITTSCYWERLSNVQGGFEGIIANDNAQGQYYVQVSASDFALSTDCEITRIGD
jgi:hypothetical protein